MTESEAIYHLCRISEIIPGYCRSEAFSVAIGALEKQVAKKPKHIETDGFWYCPNCGECAETMGYDAIQFNFCDKCGQRLEWE